MKTVYAIHTGFALVEPLKPLFSEILPGVRIVSVVDDSLLADVREAGRLTPLREFDRQFREHNGLPTAE